MIRINKNINRKRCIAQAMILLIVVIGFQGCVHDNEREIFEDEKAELSIRLKNTDGGSYETRNTGNYPTADEKKIYSLEVLVFNPDGTRNGYKSIPREVVAASGSNQYNTFKEIDEITGIKLTKGTKDIYIVANAPDNSLVGVTTRQQFIESTKDILNRQGLFKFPKLSYQTGDDIEMVDWDTRDDPTNPIGGVDMLPYPTNLTMCGFMENVIFDGSFTQYYLGYNTNGGRPTGITTGGTPKGTALFEVERLVARVAIKDISFNLPAQLQFEGTPVSVFEPWIKSFFVVGARYESCLLSPYDRSLGWMPPANFFTHAYGCPTNVYQVISNQLTLSAPLSQSSFYLCEELMTPRYDINQSAKPLWFYVFENNKESNYKTYCVIEIEYRYLNAQGQIRYKSYYYPIDFFRTNQSTEIKRNNQYRLSIKIEGLSNISTTAFTPTRSISPEIPVRVETEVGSSLFPWTGVNYK